MPLMRLYLLPLFGVLSAFAAQAAPTAQPVFETDGSFGRCQTDLAYEDGRQLRVALSPKDDIDLNLTIPRGGFMLGSHYDLTLTLPPTTTPHKVRATALNGNALQLRLGNDQAFGQELGNSRAVEVGANGTTVTFAAPAMASAFTALRACLANNVKDTAAKAESALPKALQALLATAGMTDVTPLDLSPIPPAERPADYVWQTGALLGGVREREAPKDKSLTDLIGLHLQGLRKKCAGSFTAELGREEDAPDLKLRTAEAVCAQRKKDSTPTVAVAALFYLTANGLYTVFTFESDEANNPQALAARDSLRRTLHDLALRAKTKP